jgi:hypothetical protein
MRRGVRLRSIGHYEIEHGELRRLPRPPDEPSHSNPRLLDALTRG